MEIGIITQPFSANYGGILQNWALQQVLQRMGHAPVTVECSGAFRSDHEWNCLKMNVKAVAGRMTGARPCRWTTWEKRAFLEEVAGPLRDFVSREIRTQRVPYARLKDFSARMDAWIVGSDQVWRPAYNPDLSLPFLTFAPPTVRKVAYAASFGEDAWAYSPARTAFARQAVAGFSAVSVRERSGILLCREHLGVEAVRTLDPTLLLSAEDYAALCGAAPLEGDTLAAYCLDPSPEKLQFARSFAAENALGLDVVLPFSLSGMQRRASGGFRMRPVEAWLRTFLQAGAVFTDSYHGLLFGLLFGKRIVLSPNRERGLSRFASLLEDLGLPALPDADGLIRVEGRTAGERLAALRADSHAFLRENL